MKGLPESRVKRTVEGDLGIRYNAPTIHNFIGQDRFLSKLSAQFPSKLVQECHELLGQDARQYVEFLSCNVGHVPTTEVGLSLDIVLAESAVSMAVERHAGTVKHEFTVEGEVAVQRGKNLMPVENLIGTGGIFKYGLYPERVLQSALFSSQNPWSLKPKNPKAYMDQHYMLYGIGLLAQDFPDQALRIAKKYLQPTDLHSKNNFEPKERLEKEKE
jgi:uncharacterized protein (TIGR01319 family)